MCTKEEVIVEASQAVTVAEVTIYLLVAVAVAGFFLILSKVK